MADNIKNLGKVCITPEGVWDVNKEYDRLSLVVTQDSDTQRVLSYISRKHVPKGNISIHDREYWQLFTTELRLEDITIDENGNIKMGDVVIYQIPLGDALGEIVVDKIKEDLTNHIMTEIRSYMTSMVQELINSFSNQISRLINNGIEIRNKVSGGMTNHNVDEVTHYGNINLNHNGRVEEILSGNVGVNAKISGQIYVDGDEPAPTPKYLVTINANPSDAIVTLNGVQGNSGEFEEGSTVSVVVSKSGYVTKTESITNLQQDTTLDITLVAETVQYFFRINPTEKSVGAVSSEFTVNVESVKNNQRYEYEYVVEDSDSIIQSITKVTGGVKIVTNGNSLDRTKSATIYFKQHRPEEEVMNVTIPFVITQETDTPSSYVFTSDQIRQWNAISADNGLEGIPVGTGEYGQNISTPPSIDLISTKNGESFDYEIVQKPDWINLTKDLENNKLNYTLNSVNLPYLYSQEKGIVILRQPDSGKTLQFALIRVDNLLYVIDNPFTYNKNAHYTEKLKVVSCHCTHSYGFAYINDGLSLANSNHPNWIGIDNSDLQNARTVAYANYPTGTYFEVPISIQQNTGNQRTGQVTITNGVSVATIDITQEGEDTPTPTPTYEFSVSPTVTAMKADGSSVFNPTVTSTKDSVAQSFSVDAKSDWLNVGIENNIVTITANENTGSSRAGFVRFIQNESGQTCGIDITQQGTDTFEIDGSSVANISADALNTTLNVVSIVNGEEHSPYTVESSPAWITATPNVQISKLGLQITANTGAARTGQVVCKQTATDETVTITVNQAAGSTPPPVTKYTVTVNPTPSDALVTLNDGLNPGEFDAGTDVRVFVSKPGYIAHEETIINLQENKTLNITLEQETNEFYAAQTNMQFTLDGGQLPNTIISLKNGSFIGYVLTSKPEWAIVTLDYEGDQNRINVIVGNTSSARSGNIILTQNETGNTLTITVDQHNTYELNVATKSFNIVSGGEQKSTLYTSTLNGNYVDPVVTPSDTWITYQLLSNGNNHYIQITVAENLETSQRTGTISVVNGDKSEIITITQDAAPVQDTYEFNVETTPIVFNAAGSPIGDNHIDVVSKKNGSRFDTEISAPDWVTVNRVITDAGTTYLITTSDIGTETSRSGVITITQNRSDGTSVSDSVNISQQGHIYAFVGEFTEGIVTITRTGNTKTIKPEISIDGVIQQSEDVTVNSINFASGAPYQDRFTLVNNRTSFIITGSGAFEEISTEVEISLQYGSYSKSFTFGVDWIND